MCRGANDEPVGARPARVVVLGIGNSLLTDDGAGVQAIRRLRVGDDAPGIEFIDGGTLNFPLLHCFEAVPALIVIDAAELDDAPGTVRVFEGEAMDRAVSGGRRHSVHEAGLADVLAMARLIDCLPPRRALISVQPQSVDWGESLSPAVARVLPEICERARELALQWAA